MASYPSIAVSVGSVEETIDPLLVSRSRSGALKARRLQTGAKKRFRVVHEMLSATDKGTLATFYTNNRSVSLSFTWPADSQIYTVVFAREPQWTPLEAGIWKVAVELEEV